MAERGKKSFLSKIILDTSMIIFSLFNVVPKIIYLIESEARLAKKNLVSLIILFLIAAAFITSIWLCILAMGFIYLISLHLSLLVSLSIIILINILLLIITCLLISRAKHQISFPETRHLLKTIHLRKDQ